MLDIAAIGIEVDTSGVRRGSQDLQKLGEQAGRAADRTVATEMAFDRLSRQMARFNGLAGVAVGFLGVAALTSYARELVKVADAYSSVNSRLQVATGSTLEAAQAQEKLFAVAQKTRASFTETADLFAKLTTSTKELGVSQDRLVGITETVNKAITLSGASSQAAQAALVQFGQGLASGTLRGEELNSILEQTPALAKALADGLGVPVGSLRKLGEEGKITADRIIEAFEKVRDSVDRDFAKVATTVDSAFTVLKNSFGKAVSEADKTTGATSAISTAVLNLAADIDDLVKSPEFSQYLGSIKTGFLEVAGAVSTAATEMARLVQFAADNQGTFKFLAEVFVGLRGASVGAATGAAFGSAVPVIGTAAGAAVGAGVGYIGAVQATSSVSDAITGDEAIRRREALRQETERLIAKEAEYQRKLESAGSGSRLFYQNALKAIQSDLAKATAESAKVEGELQDRFLRGVFVQSQSAAATANTIVGSKALTKEQEKAQEAYDKLIAGIKAKTAEASLELSGDQALTGAQKEALKITMDLATGKVQYTDSQKRAITAALEENIAVERALELQKAYEQAQKEALGAKQKVLDEAYKSTEAIIKEREQIEEQIKAVGLSKSEVEALRAAKLDDAIATLEQKIAMESFGDANDDLILAYRRQIDELRKLKQARQGLSSSEAADELRKGQEKVFDGLYKELSRGITDSIFRGFEGGKKFIQSFKDAIKNAFKSLIIKFAVQPVLGSVVGGIASSLGFSGLAQAATRELGSFAGIGDGSGGIIGGGFGGGARPSEIASLKSLYDALSSGISGISGAVTNGINNLGAYLATSNNNLAASVGDYIVGSSTQAGGGVAGFAGSAATGAAAIGLAYGGYQLGRGISGGYSLNGGTGNAAVNIGAVAGAFLGAGNPISIAIGSAIGSIIGGAVNRLFGSKRVLGASGIEGTFAEQGFSGKAFQDVTIKRKLRSSKSFTEFSDIPTDTLDALSNTFADLKFSAKSASRVLGLDLSAAIDAVRVSGRFQVSTQEQMKATLDRLSDEIVKQALPATEQLTTVVGNGFFRLVKKTTTEIISELEQFRQTGENLIQTLTRISGAVSEANAAAVLLGKGNLFSLDNAQAALSFQSIAGEAAKSLDSVLQNFLPASDLAARRVALIEDQLRQLGLDSLVSVRSTREEFGRALQSRDITTETGQRELALLLQMAPAIDSVIRQREAEAKVLADLSQAIAEAVSRQRDQLQSELFDLTASATESLQAQRNALDESNRAIFDQIQAVKAQMVITEQRTALEQEIFELTATEAQALEAQRNALDESNRALFDRIQALKAEKTAAEALLRIQQQGGSIREFIDSLRVGNNTLTEQQRLQVASGNFNELLGRARVNDESALADIQSAASTLIDAASGLFSTSTDYQVFINKIIGDLAALPAVMSFDQQSFNPLKNVPAFASGGSFLGGVRLVGERGPELEVTGPSRIFSAEQTRNMMQGGASPEMVAEIRALRQEVVQLRSENRIHAQTLAVNTGKTARILERADDGDSLNVKVVVV